jgi:hypothetical protein
MLRVKFKPKRKSEFARWDNQDQGPSTPVGPGQIADFDPDREMRQKPHPEGSRWRK